MLKGETPFRESIDQDFDRKKIKGAFPLQLMAAGKVMLTFSSVNRLDITDQISSLYKDSTMLSTTGQLKWCEAGKGYFTINTPGTKGLVGFAKNKIVNLGEVNLQTSNEFAVILISSLEKNQSIAQSNKILVTTIARAKNTGMKYNSDHSKLLETGNAPILIEPVKLTLSIIRKSIPRVTVLNHSGHKTKTLIKLINGSWLLDGSQSKSMYYLIEFQ